MRLDLDVEVAETGSCKDVMHLRGMDEGLPLSKSGAGQMDGKCQKMIQVCHF